MDLTFRDSGLKWPLWEEVSRKLAEQGYSRTAKKCKEKFENVHTYYKKTKDGKAGRQEVDRSITRRPRTGCRSKLVASDRYRSWSRSFSQLKLVLSAAILEVQIAGFAPYAVNFNMGAGARARALEFVHSACENLTRTLSWDAFVEKLQRWMSNCLDLIQDYDV